ncbi:gp103 [Rhodococcus phage ReqiDocB7]|uniref:gp103 n=1 Tax=Rhodococcus phage ReqiDocB7 TaxID=691966 RepID=UPI0001CDD880|nr:gp103 [Rhodococcus phage ReqiDocB7]ADD80889.1 gp103 [Rhodococcus phage ReqiDocB7]
MSDTYTHFRSTEVRRDPFNPEKLTLIEHSTNLHVTFPADAWESMFKSWAESLVNAYQRILRIEHQSTVLALQQYQAGRGTSMRAVGLDVMIMAYRHYPAELKKSDKYFITLPSGDVTFKSLGRVNGYYAWDKASRLEDIEFTNPPVARNMPPLSVELEQLYMETRTLADEVLTTKALPQSVHIENNGTVTDLTGMTGVYHAGATELTKTQEHLLDQMRQQGSGQVHVRDKSGSIVTADGGPDPDKMQELQDFMKANGAQRINTPEGPVLVMHTEPATAKKKPKKRQSAQTIHAKNPRYWAHAAEDKINGILQQARQNLGHENETTVILNAISECLSDHIAKLGGE